jgi:hypothetical protein
MGPGGMDAPGWLAARGERDGLDPSTEATAVETGAASLLRKGPSHVDRLLSQDDEAAQAPCSASVSRCLGGPP